MRYETSEIIEPQVNEGDHFGKIIDMEWDCETNEIIEAQVNEGDHLGKIIDMEWVCSIQGAVRKIKSIKIGK